MKEKHMFATRCILVLACSTLLVKAQSFCDDSMSAWGSQMVDSAGATFAASALAAGGTVTPACYQFTHALDGTTIGARIHLVHLPTGSGSFFLPALPNNLGAIDLSVDVRAVAYAPANSFGGVIAIQWAALQNGIVYLSNSPGYFNTSINDLTWRHYQSLNLPLSTFVDPVTHSSPSFAAGPISFGVATGNSCSTGTCGVPRSATGRLDSFCVSIHVAPVTSSLCTGCVGTLGVPGNSAGLGRIGQPFIDTFTNLPMNAAFFVLGFSSTVASVGPLPFALTNFGAPGCFLCVSPDRSVFGVGSGGTASFTVMIPGVPNVLGMHFYTQGASLDPVANALGMTTTNAADVLIGN